MSVLTLFAVKGSAPRYQSKHRLAAPEDTQDPRSWPEEGRRAAKHAAQPSAKASRGSGSGHAAHAAPADDAGE
jgi:hypothetical protein